MTPLHVIGDFFRNLLLAVPLPAVRAIFLLVPLLLLVWVLRLPREDTRPLGGTGRWDEDLKLWAAVALLIQVAVYSLF